VQLNTQCTGTNALWIELTGHANNIFPWFLQHCNPSISVTIYSRPWCIILHLQSTLKTGSFIKLLFRATGSCFKLRMWSVVPLFCPSAASLSRQTDQSLCTKVKINLNLSVYHPGVFIKLNNMGFISQTHLLFIYLMYYSGNTSMFRLTIESSSGPYIKVCTYIFLHRSIVK